MKNFFKILIVIMIITVVCSVFFSNEIYSFYVKTYYTLRKPDVNAMIENAKKLYKEKKYIELEKYLAAPLIAYPQHAGLKRIAGLNYIALGKKRKGAEILLDTIGSEGLPSRMLRMSIKILFDQGMYGDIVGSLKNGNPGNDPVVTYYYGVSLYMTGNYKQAVNWLYKAHRYGDSTIELYYYLGNSYNKINKLPQARKYLEKAYRLNAYEKNIRRALLDVYRKLKLYDQAHKIMTIRRRTVRQ